MVLYVTEIGESPSPPLGEQAKASAAAVTRRRCQRYSAGMDNVDRAIMAILQEDGRASHVELARRLGVSEGTVRRRVAKLLKGGVIRVVAVAEPERLGYHTSAFIGLQVDPARVEAVATELAALSEAEHVAITTGSFDIFVWVNVESLESLAAFLHGKIGKVRGVHRTETFVSLETRKRSTGPGVPGG